MPRLTRFTVPNGIYHVLSRGNNRQSVFHDKTDFREFFDLLKHYKQKYTLTLYHYVLMSNHFHIIVRAEGGKSLSEALKSIKHRYAQSYRKKYAGTGHLWEERFKSFIIENGKYLLGCGRYVELNPVRAQMVEKPEDYEWSSYKVYALGSNDGVTDHSPEYKGLGNSAEYRQRNYTGFVTDGYREKRKLDRFFRTGAYGSKEFVAARRLDGLKQLWSHKGRPRKEK